MKTKKWLLILGALLLLCAGLSLPMFFSGEMAAAEIYSGGKLIKTVPLSIDQSFTVISEDGGENEITVKDGAIAVTKADCPDHYCMHRGFCSGGSSIVCLPNRLVIEFAGTQEVDGAVG